MPLHNNYFKIGLFAFAGLGLFLAGLLAFGLRGSLKPTLQCVTFFDRSVQGISRDSSVKFRGFEVGRVTSIALSSVEDKDGPPVVRVMFSIDPAALGGKNSDVEEARAYMLRQVEHGLQAVLSFQGVTGLGFLDLDYREKAPGASLEALGARVSADQLVFVPNGPGSIMEISESATQIVKSLREVDFAGLSRDINALV
ncbi:MAG: MlaD family protein, partial [Candidatus Adiutrix sp.]|nr:MlaD family protein [Candidatus Adiutrix sp.]